MIMPPGGATPEGALGHVAGALEVAAQIDAGVCPLPKHLVLPCGSGCTTAGLMVGLAIARHLGYDLGRNMPRLHAVRISVWPATSRFRIIGLARRTIRLLARLGVPDVSDAFRVVLANLRVTGRYLGGGYGHPTEAACAANELFRRAGSVTLDSTYSGKAAAALLDLVGSGEGPFLFWSTKSASPLPASSHMVEPPMSARVKSWLEACGSSERPGKALGGHASGSG